MNKTLVSKDINVFQANINDFINNMKAMDYSVTDIVFKPMSLAMESSYSTCFTACVHYEEKSVSNSIKSVEVIYSESVDTFNEFSKDRTEFIFEPVSHNMKLTAKVLFCGLSINR
jgi:hypothetical protein